MCSATADTSTKNKYPAINIISHDELEDTPTKSVGSGTFGNCYLKKFTRFGIKVVEKQLMDGSIDMVYREANYMQTFSHRCIPHLLGIQVEKKPLSLIMEFVGENDQSITVHKLLFDAKLEKLKKSKSIKDWLCICYDITDALDHMHQKGYIHCDLKTNNVLVFQRKGYLIDFGKVRGMHSTTGKKYQEVYSHIATEVLKGCPPNFASDVYSLGKVFKI